MSTEDDMSFLDKEEDKPTTQEIIVELAFNDWWLENHGKSNPFYKPIVKKGFIAAVKWITMEDLDRIPF